MEIIVCIGVVSLLALICAILGAKLSQAEKEANRWKDRALELNRESNDYWNKYNSEKFENIMLKSQNSRLQRELFRAWDIVKSNDNN